MGPQGPVLAIAMAALAHTTVDVCARGQERIHERAITQGYGLTNVTILGQVVPAGDGNRLPSGVWVTLRGIFGYEQRQLVGPSGLSPKRITKCLRTAAPSMNFESVSTT